MALWRRLILLDQRLSVRLALPPKAHLPRLLALLAARSGDSPLWLTGAGTAFIWGGAVGRDFCCRVVAGTLTTGAVVLTLKWLFRRTRPPGKGRGFYTWLDRHAFPSGHAGRCACLTVLLIPLLPSGWAIPLLLWTGLVGLARVALQVHFVSDIVGGWAVGLVVGLGLRLAF